MTHPNIYLTLLNQSAQRNTRFSWIYLVFSLLVTSYSSNIKADGGQQDARNLFSAAHWVTFETRMTLDAQVPLANEECCTNPGAIASCWWLDAERDGVICREDGDCGSDSCVKDIDVSGSSPPNGWGLCECEDSDDCVDGICRNGVCGPSYCNGFLVCACWGGCKEADSWGYDSPDDACSDTASGFPGDCCEGTYASSPEGVGAGYCSDVCPDPEEPECELDSDCTGNLGDSLSVDCAEEVCNGGVCGISYINIGTVCTDNVITPDSMPSWHENCRRYQCGVSGLCELTQLPEGTSCDDDDICTLTSLCGSDGDCEAETPNATPDECCNPSVETTYDDSNPCTDDDCSSAAADPPFRDLHENEPDSTACNNATDRINDTCGIYVCESGTCVETTSDYIGSSCRLDDWTDCLKYVCSANAGDEGDCVEETMNEGETCAWPNAPDTCDKQICRAGVCTYELAVGATDCTPQAGPVNTCCDYECNADNDCTAVNCSSTDESQEVCDGTDLGVLDENQGSLLTVSTTNRCASNDYNVGTSGRFATCSVVDSGETVHHYTETSHLDEYQLRHTEAELSVDGSWSPVLYTSTSCENSATQADQYSCSISGASRTGMTGPWPLVDTPDVEDEDDVTTVNTQVSTVFVDSRNTESPAGGTYTLDLEVVEHDNDSCINTADSVAAPHLIGEHDWKLRFRGNVDGYENFFQAQSIAQTGHCWDGGSPTADNPKYGFFYVDVLPKGSDTLSSGTVDWDRTYKLYTDPLGTGNMADVLSFYGNNSEDGDCRSALTNQQYCRNTSLLAPREIVIESDGDLRKGFAAVSNRDSIDDDTAPPGSGDYELNLLRVPRPFLGLTQQFVGPSNGLGCSCNQEVNWTQSFNLVGHRLDFIPTNDDVNGFSVRKTTVDSPSQWLVEIENNSDTLVCEGVGCVSPSKTTPYDMMFQFPYSGELWSKFCVDAAGRAILAKNDDCENQWYSMPNSNEFHYGDDPDEPTPSIAPLWGTIVPCNRFTEPGCSVSYWPISCRTPGAGDLTCESNSCGSCMWDPDCYLWKWNETSCANPGRILKELRSFEGTSAMVITWEGFDGASNPLNNGPDHALDFQLILRVDGRITFFYRIPDGGASDITQIMNTNGWIVGLSGGRTVSCDNDNDCDQSFDTTGLVCDNENTTVSALSKTYTVWEANGKCINKVDLQSASDVPVSGTWQGE